MTLHVHSREENAEGFPMWLASPALSPTERVMVWHGFPPPPVESSGGLAPVVLVGEVDGRVAYAEQVPGGRRLAEGAPPEALRPYVVKQLLRSLAGLHGARQVHGQVGPGAVVLGAGGEVVLAGRGRRGGVPSQDVAAALALLPEGTVPDEGSANRAAEAVLAFCRPGDRATLAAWVQAQEADAAGERPLRSTTQRVSRLVFVVQGSQVDTGVDEVAPDVGPERDGERGLLERWSATTAGRGLYARGEPEDTADLTGRGSRNEELELTLWSRLAALPQQPMERSRFAQVEGAASRGLRTLLADEAPDGPPLPLVAQVLDFAAEETGGAMTQPMMLQRMDPQPEQSTAERPTTERTPVRAQVRRSAPGSLGGAMGRGVQLGLAAMGGGLLVWVILSWLGW